MYCFQNGARKKHEVNLGEKFQQNASEFEP
jgi:hypothetical protein